MKTLEDDLVEKIWEIQRQEQSAQKEIDFNPDLDGEDCARYYTQKIIQLIREGFKARAIEAVGNVLGLTVTAKGLVIERTDKEGKHIKRSDAIKALEEL